MTVRSAVEAAKAWATEQDNREAIMGDKKSRYNATPCINFCNASHVKRSPTSIFSELSKSMEMFGDSDEEAKNYLNKKLTLSGSGAKRLCILVIDELDLIGQAGTRGADVLDTLYGWAKDEDKSFALVCISNSIKDGQDLKSEGKVAAVEAFSSYGQDKILSIVKGRAGEGVFQDAALKLISKKVRSFKSRIDELRRHIFNVSMNDVDTSTHSIFAANSVTVL